MSLELTKLKSENIIYMIVGDPYTKVVRHIWRNLTIKSYKWTLQIIYRHYSEDFSDFSDNVVYECKNYTRDTLSRRFREWRELSFDDVSDIRLEKIEQFFFTSLKNVV